MGKSVVNIASVRMMQDQLFRVFPVEGVGSGVVIDEKGHILTNNHVIDDAERLKRHFVSKSRSKSTARGKKTRLQLPY